MDSADAASAAANVRHRELERDVVDAALIAVGGMVVVDARPPIRQGTCARSPAVPGIVKIFGI
jgi:hypothetical protein